MNAYPFDIALVIGRFQPWHAGHSGLLAHALGQAPCVVVVLGSAWRARDARNPFTWEERAAMIRLTLSEAERERVIFLPLRDEYDDARWQHALLQGVARSCGMPGGRIALVAPRKDPSNDALRRIPGCTLLEAPRLDGVKAGDLRKALLGARDDDVLDARLSGRVHPEVQRYLRDWLRQDFVAALRDEHAAVERNKAAWSAAPYPPIFVTVDALVLAAGHVLLIQRGGDMGKGLWALPGGFVEPRERLLQSAIRELREETGPGVTDLDLENTLKAVAVFDHPDRSQRGRTITHVHFFDLGAVRLPEVAGADDAAAAKWIPVESLPGMEEQFFEDHYSVLRHFLQADA